MMREDSKSLPLTCMKKIINILFFLLMSVGCFAYGRYVCTQPSYEFRSTSNSAYLGSNTNSMPVSGTRIGYTTVNYGYSSYRGVSTTSGGSYSPTPSYSGRGGGPRKSPEHPNPTDPPTYNPFSSAFWRWYNSEEGQDWIRINGSPWGIIADPDANWPQYVDPDWWDWFLENYPEYEDYVEQWFNNYPDAPNNPFKTPIGEPIIPLVLLTFAYGAYKTKLKKTT